MFSQLVSPQLISFFCCLSCKIFFFLQKQSIEVDNANIISGHFSLVPEFAHLLCTASFHPNFSNFMVVFKHSYGLYVYVYFEKTKTHLIVKPTKARTNPQALVLLCFFFSHFPQGNLYSWDASKPNSNVKLVLQPHSELPMTLPFTRHLQNYADFSICKKERLFSPVFPHFKT